MGVLAWILSIFGIFIFAIYLVRRWLSKQWGYSKREEEEDVRGRIVIVTGASCGIGKVAATEFADRHARVIVTARSMEAAKQAVVDIRQKTFFGEIIPMQLDLGSVQSIKEFYHEIIKRFDTIDILVNNAGVLEPSENIARTSDGFEIHFGVNHLGHFLLTNLLLPLLKNAENSRIVVVSSGAYKSGQLNYDDLNWKKNVPPQSPRFGDYPLYKNSKLANVLFAKELAKRLEGTGVHVYTLCPGNVLTSIGRRLKIPPSFWLSIPFVLITIKTPWQGCQTILYCALSKKCAYESGLMYRNCDLWTKEKTYFPDDTFMPVPEDWDEKIVLSDGNALRLWDESEKLLQMKFPVVS